MLTSSFFKFGAGFTIGVIVCLVALFVLVAKQNKKNIAAASGILRRQFSSQGLSSEELTILIDKGFRARMWDELSDFLGTRPSYDEVIDILGPPDDEIRDDDLAKVYGKEHLSEGQPNVQISYKWGRFNMRAEPSDTFVVIEVLFQKTKFATWCGVGLKSGAARASSADSRSDSQSGN